MRVTAKAGFTLIELLIGLAIGGIAAGFMISTLGRQQRFYASASAILDTRAQLRDAADILATDIRSAAVDLGVPAMRDSAIEMFTTVASSIVCTTSSPQSLGLPPLKLSSGISLTSILAQPDTGDLALVYTTASRDSGSWELRRIAAFATRSVATACPAATGFTISGDATSGQQAYNVTLASPTLNALRPGAPVQFIRRSRYSLYKSSDNRWYLGYRRCNAIGPSACAAIQPVSGPYDPYAAGKAGLTFRYYNRLGGQLTPASDGTDLARVDLIIRGTSARHANLVGDSDAHWSDSTVVSIATRNRFP